MFSDLPLLPARARSMDGQDVDTSSRVWKLRSSSDGGALIAINLHLLGGPEQNPALSERAIQLVSLYLFDRIQRKNSRTVRNDFSAICRFDCWLSSRQLPKLGEGKFNWGHFDETLARAFLDHGIRNTCDKGNDFSRLRTFYRWGLAHQHRDFRLETAVELKSILAIGMQRGTTSGSAIR